MNEQDLDAFFRDALLAPSLDEDQANHPAGALLMDYVHDQLEPQEKSRVSAHVARCGRCRTTVATWQDALQALDTHFEPAFAHTPPSSEPAAEVSLTDRLKRWWRAKGWTSHRAFWGHTLAYAGAGGVLLFIRLALPESLLQSEGPNGPTPWILWLLGVAALAWGLWLIVLVIHGVRAWLVKQ